MIFIVRMAGLLIIASHHSLMGSSFAITVFLPQSNQQCYRRLKVPKNET